MANLQPLYAPNTPRKYPGRDLNTHPESQMANYHVVRLYRWYNRYAFRQLDIGEYADCRGKHLNLII